jgi:hypothetical protein
MSISGDLLTNSLIFFTPYYLFMRTSGTNVIKLFTVLIYKLAMSVIVFIIAKLFLTGLIFTSKAEACPSGEPFKLKRLGRDKHSSLLGPFVNYGCKKFYNIGPLYTSRTDFVSKAY